MCGTFERTSSCTTVLVVSRTRTVCRSFNSSRPFSISCHNMLIMFPAAAWKTHTCRVFHTGVSITGWTAFTGAYAVIS